MLRSGKEEDHDVEDVEENDEKDETAAEDEVEEDDVAKDEVEDDDVEEDVEEEDRFQDLGPHFVRAHSRNACQNITRGTSCGNLQEKCGGPE